MGLDMYLDAKFCLSVSNRRAKQLSEVIPSHFPEIRGWERGGFEGRCPTVSAINGIKLSVGYWRKANRIHRWFVENVQDGEDNCSSYAVSQEQLEALKQVCEKVLANRSLAQELLPTGDGFFFGNTEYGDFYFRDLQDTVAIIDKALSLNGEWEFEYHSSW